MAQTRKKRKTKHRGTQAGTIDRAGRTSRTTRQEARTTTRKTASERRATRYERPPTWRGALNRAAMAAALFAILVILVFHRNPVGGVIGGVFAFLFYVPVGYYTDRMLYNRYQRRRERARG
jgi:lipopolysaccharide export LptBFGC system permease protein LptF